MLVAACVPVNSSPAATPTGAATLAPTASRSSAPSKTIEATSSPTAIPLPNTARVAAAGKGVVWMLVGQSHLFRSTDRGNTWEERGLPRAAFANTDIAFIDDRQGWLMAIGSAASQCQVQSVTLYRTTDGAETWQQLTVRGIADADCKADLAFTDAMHGYFSTFSPNSAPRVYRTGDGGQTWNAASALADPPGFSSGPAG